MSHLLPCPGCNRHVLNTEASCPFCARPLDLRDRPAPVLPRTRLGRAATFAFGAGVVGATTLVGCSGETTETHGAGGATSGGSTGSAGASSGGSSSSGGSDGSGGSNTAGSSSAGAGGMVLDDGGVQPLYGAVPAAGSGNAADAGAPVPLYGAAPSR